MRKCKEFGKIPESVGINAWGVDFVLLDESDQVIGNCVSYRDLRTKGIMRDVLIAREASYIFNKTGIQFQEFNTLYQLMSLDADIKAKATRFLMLPDYINYLLTNKQVSEYSNAVTTQMFNSSLNSWDYDLVELSGLRRNAFCEPLMHSARLGKLDSIIVDDVGYQCEVVLPLTHDTASAFLASTPDTNEDCAVLISGTWSLLGMETDNVLDLEYAETANYTAGTGYSKNSRVQKNIMGLWIIQEVSRNLQHRYSYSELAALARESSDFLSTFDVNDKRFFMTTNMIEEIVEYCIETNQPSPSTVGEVSMCVYRSLASSFSHYLSEVEKITGNKISKINILGGGSKNELLNELVAQQTQRDVILGPVEATAIGNIISQMMAYEEVASIDEAKAYIW
jgi:rhamnulokinase